MDLIARRCRAGAMDRFAVQWLVGERGTNPYPLPSETNRRTA